MNIQPSSEPAKWPAGQNVCSKTDLKGRITYVNRAFMHISNMHEGQLLGKQQSVIRHPDMPKGFFRHMWHELDAQHEFTGVIKNITAQGKYYWVMALINGTEDGDGHKNGYFSVRRQASPSLIAQFEPIYTTMREMERDGGEHAVEESRQYFLQHSKNLLLALHDHGEIVSD